MVWPWARQELGRLLAVCPRLRVHAGTVHCAGDFSETAFLIVEKGIFVIASDAQARRRIVLGFCPQGSLFPPPSWDEQLVALRDSVLVCVSPEVQRLLLRLPSAAEAIVEALVEAVRERQQSLAQFGNGMHTERLRGKLLQLARTHGSVVTGGVRLELPLTHELLAQTLGSARETVTCSLRALEREGFVVREGRRYRLAISPTILDPE
jgi:CRP/FNR family transcriptional regulator, cyclic AMP receptor protein